MTDTVLIREKLKETLGEHRYEHTLGVAYTAICLAMKYGVNLYQAELAGLLHDCAKYLKGRDQLACCLVYHIDINKTEYANPSLLHAKLGAFFAEHSYGIKDTEVLQAIMCHTTGKPAMSLLEKIIFVADYIEPKRDKAPNLTQIRKVAFEDIDKAVWMILEDTLSYLRSQPESIDEMTETACKYYRELIKGAVKDEE